MTSNLIKTQSMSVVKSHSQSLTSLEFLELDCTRSIDN